MKLDTSWKSNRTSLINLVSLISLIISIKLWAQGILDGAILGIVVYGGLSWILDKVLPKGEGLKDE